MFKRLGIARKARRAQHTRQGSRYLAGVRSLNRDQDTARSSSRIHMYQTRKCTTFAEDRRMSHENGAAQDGCETNQESTGRSADPVRSVCFLTRPAAWARTATRRRQGGCAFLPDMSGKTMANITKLPWRSAGSRETARVLGGPEGAPRTPRPQTQREDVTRQDQATRPRRKPWATACARSRTPSLRNNRLAWVLTVSSER